MDVFYKDLEGSSLEMANKQRFNFDRPEALDFDLAYEKL